MEREKNGETYIKIYNNKERMGGYWGRTKNVEYPPAQGNI